MSEEEEAVYSYAEEEVAAVIDVGEQVEEFAQLFFHYISGHVAHLEVRSSHVLWKMFIVLLYMIFVVWNYYIYWNYHFNILFLFQ